MILGYFRVKIVPKKEIFRVVNNNEGGGESDYSPERPIIGRISVRKKMKNSNGGIET